MKLDSMVSVSPLHLTIFFFFFFYLPFSSSASFPEITHLSSTCPMNFTYVSTLPLNSTSCQNYNQNDSKSNCCVNLLSFFGVGLAQHLKQTSLFQLPDLPTSISCLHDYQSKLTSISLPNNIVSLCFDPMQFVISPDICANITTTQDWVARLGESTQLNTACRSDLTDFTSCDACVAAGFRVQSRLITIDGNRTHATDCFYFTILYAAGIVNELGPESTGAVACILAVSLNTQPHSNSSHLALVFGLTGAGVAILVMSCLLALYFWYEKVYRRKKMSQLRSNFGIEIDEQGSRPRLRPKTGSIWFKIKDLKKATDNFSQKKFIGRGGFGFVYKGVLPDGTTVAVKRIVESDFQGNAEFCNEVEIISNLKHRNLVSLRGCCVVDDDENFDNNGCQRYVVYDYMPNGNLHDHLFPSFDDQNGIPNTPLSWPQRKNIILDVAKGLAYLHYGVKPAIYHRDINGTNILLDADMRARVADFGLAKQSREGQSHLTTRVAGTHGYLAPEYALYGQLTEKSDVYSFGVVILETICGRKALDLSSAGSTQAFLITDWAWSLVKAGKTEEALDPALLKQDDSLNSNPKIIMERFLQVGILCAHVTVALRPTILDTLKMLEGDIEVPPIPDRPQPLGQPSFYGNGNTFNISSALTGPQLHKGDTQIVVRHIE